MATRKEKEVYMTSGNDVERHSDEKVNHHRKSSLGGVVSGDTNAIEGQLFSMNDIDPALDAKMRLVNNVSNGILVSSAPADHQQAINQIGWTNFHLKLFCLTGFGYMADSLILVTQSVIAGQAAAEFQPHLKNGLTFAAYTGMLIGALFWVRKAHPSLLCN